METKKYKTKVQSFRIHVECEACLEELEFNGSVLMCAPPQYEHKCPKCGGVETFSKKYPCIEEWPVEPRMEHGD